MLFSFFRLFVSHAHVLSSMISHYVQPWMVSFDSCLHSLLLIQLWNGEFLRFNQGWENFSFTYFVHNLYVCSFYLQHFYIHEKNNLNITTAKKVFWLKQYVPLGSFNALMHKYMEPISCISTALFVEDKESDWSTQV